MNSNDTTKLFGNTFTEFMDSYHAQIHQLSADVQNKVKEIIKNYFAGYGYEGTYRRLNGCTISQILATYRPAEVKVIESGETDGVRWTLYDAPVSEAGEAPAAD